MKRITTFTYVYCGIVAAAAVIICMGFLHDETINTIERTSEIVNNSIYMAGEILESVSVNKMIQTETDDGLPSQSESGQQIQAKAGKSEKETVKADIPEPILPVEEYKALCRIVQAEAGNQDAKGKQLIANVVLNRVKNESFPDTVQEVILQDNGGITQFSPTKNGSYHAAEISVDTMAAVNRAIAGEDLSDGALYFKAGSETQWGGLQFLFQHGDHVFFM
ncbi:MAG: cell wall hydrolase [bacterium]|nr:cell wall hydrolase [bacterium]